MTNFIKTDLSGDQNLGLYGFATDKYCFLGVSGKKIKSMLKVPVYECTIMDTNFSGIFVAGNSHGIIISQLVRNHEMRKLKQHFDNILVLKTRYSAIGNLVMMNDSGAVISPLLKKHKADIKKFFDFNCEMSTIAGQRIVGNLGKATNKGCVLHPKVKEAEKKLVEETLNVQSDIGTVNYGSPYPGASIIANSNGIAVSERTSGPELGRLIEVFGFL